MAACSSSSLIVDKYRMGATRTLVITNLKQNTTVDDLKTTFETFGEIIQIDFNKSIDVSTSDKTTGKCAIIEYVDILSVEKAILTMDGEILEGNCINLSFGKTTATNCVWIDGISEKVSEKYLNVVFEQFGFVTNSEIDRSRQQALVFFQMVTDAQSAISRLHGTILKGNRLQLDFASMQCQQEFYEHLNEKSHQLVGNSPNDADIHNSNNSLAVDFDKNNSAKTASTCISRDSLDVADCVYNFQNSNNGPVKIENSFRSNDTINDCTSQTKQAENYLYINQCEKQQHSSSKSLQLNEYESSNLGCSKYDNDYHSSPDSVSNDSQSCNDAQQYNEAKLLEERLQLFNKRYELWEQSRTNINNRNSNTKPQTKYNYFDTSRDPKPSDILKKLLLKPNVFNNDTKRLEHLSDRYITKNPLSFQGIVENSVSPPLLESSMNGSLKHPSATFSSTNNINCLFPSHPPATKTSQHYRTSTNSQSQSKNRRSGSNPKLIVTDNKLPPCLEKSSFLRKDNSAMNSDKYVHDKPKETANKNKPEKKTRNNDERFKYINQWIAESYAYQTQSNLKKEEDVFNDENEKLKKMLKEIFHSKEECSDYSVNGDSQMLTEGKNNQNTITSQILKEPDTDFNVNLENTTTKPVSNKPMYEHAIRKTRSSEQQSLKRKMSDSADNLKVDKIIKMNDATLVNKNSNENNKRQTHKCTQKNKEKKARTPSKIKFEDSCTKDEDKNLNQPEANMTYNISMYDKLKARSASKMLLQKTKMAQQHKKTIDNQSRTRQKKGY